MKNKPRKHQDKNTFKFQPFSERIGNIKIDIYHLVKHKYEEESEEVTYFYQTLEKWTLLNCSESFQQLKNEITENVQILPQILTLKDELVDILKKHLSNKNLYNLQAVLELIVSLAKDLRQEFYPYFLPIYELLVPLLSVQDAELIEQTFQCLAYLFKFLWRYLAENLSTIFESLLPLLSSTKPNYINNFAAQSFAFVARKIKDQTLLLKIILKSLRKCHDGIEGCGRLMFEVIRGVNGQFHSCAEKTLNSLFLAVNDVTLPQNLMWQLLHSTVSNVVKFIYVEHISLLWDVVFVNLASFCSKWEQHRIERNTTNVKEILKLVSLMVTAKDCKYLIRPENILEHLIPYLKILTTDEEISNKVSQIFTPILLSNNTKLSYDLSKQFVTAATTYFSEETFLCFITTILKCSSFELIFLPVLLDYCKQICPKRILPFLSKLILNKAPLTSGDGETYFHWTPYSLNFSDKNLHFSETYITMLSNNSHKNYLKDFDNIVRILIVLPHLKGIQRNPAIDAVKNLIVLLCQQISELQNHQSENNIAREKSVFLACVAVETLIRLKPEDAISHLCPVEVLVNALLPFMDAGHLYVLRILDYYITLDEVNSVTSVYSTLKDKLIPNLLSPYHKVREITIHLLYEIEKSIATSEEMIDFLEICWKAETVPPTLSEYREKLKFLQKLDPVLGSVKEAIIKNKIDHQIILRFLIGILYVNFKLMWPPVSKLISSYANILNASQFWAVFGPELAHIGTVIREQIDEPKFVSYFQCEDLETAFKNLNDLSDRPDHINYRILLWDVLAECVNVCEMKNRDIVSQFFLFLEEEYWKRHSDHAKCWNIALQNMGNSNANNEENSWLNQTDLDVEKNATDGNENNDGDIKKDLSELLQTDDILKYRSLTKSLLAHMKVLSKIRSAKNVYREPELYKVYMEFLSHKLADVQKAALDCLMNYKHKYLLPYREHLYALIDDKTFKNEITAFRIDTDSDVVKQEHRLDLIPFVLRIVYSKMYSKGSSAKGASKQERKATVIRFLAGCSFQELNSFFEMAFAIFHEKIIKNDKIISLAEKAISDVNLEDVIPPKKVQSQIYLLNTVLVYCGGLLEDKHQTYILKILISLSGHVAGVYKQRDRVHPSYVRTLRDIRNACFEGIIKFFEKFETYPWSQNEIDAVFSVFVWPYLLKLPIEGIYSPSAQLRLFIIWSKNPRFFVLLGKYHEVEKISVLSVIFKLWLSPKIHASVSNAIMDIIYNLLTLQQEDANLPEFRRIEVTNPHIISKEKLSSLKQSINYGSILLLTFIPEVLEMLQRKLSTKLGLSRKDVEVMSRLTELVKDPESSDKLMLLLLPRLIKKSNCNDEVIIPLLNTAHNLIKNVDNPERYIRKLAPLYGTIEVPSARKLLFSIVIELSKHDRPEFGLDEELLSDLNAWDAKWIEQPDFNRRLKAFKKLEMMAAEKNISVNLGIIVIHTCFHFINTEKDLSLRENSKYCLQQVCPALCYSQQTNIKDKYFVIGSILNLIKKGITQKEKENVRNDLLCLLGHLARECSEEHPLLNDLAKFTNSSDLEVDFFENLQHLQLHRRMRALLRFTTICESLDKPLHSRTLMEFLLPIISHYLLSEKYTKHTIIDSAIKALGTICRMLPWRQYQGILTNFITKLQEDLEHQKQLVRIIVEILNAFHFDLSLADINNRYVNMKIEEENNGNNKDESIKPEDLNKEKKNNVEEQEEESGDEFQENMEEINSLRSKEEEEEMVVNEYQSPVKALEQLSKLTKPNATKVIELITVKLLPQLYKTLAQRTQSDVQHKLNRKTTGPDRDEEDILRVPLAVAIVKLLQKLPSKHILDRHLPGVLMKLCTFLKSRLESVRRVTRETLQTIMESLGADYLPALVREMSTLLTKGFHVHVLVYSLHSVLRTLTPHYKKGDLDKCIHSIIQVCRIDLFGYASEEKEVNQILGKVMEARANRSYDTFHILAQYTSENYLLNIVIPLKEELSRTMSHKIVSKVRECLNQIVLGLTENTYVPAESLLEFAYGTASESIPALTADLKQEPTDPKKLELEPRKQQPDTFIIPDEPKKKKALQSIACSRTNANLLVEFGLRLFYFLFKREKLKDQNYAGHIDPVVKLLYVCLKSEHIRVSILATQCLCWVLKMDLPSVRVYVKEISISLFSILHKYASAGLSNKGENFELVMTTFKAVAVIVRDVKHYELNSEQIRTLLLYCEQDLDDYARQVSAFSLLKVIIKKKIDAPELFEIMKKVGKLSVTSNEGNVRLQARQVMLHYLLEYPIGERVEILLSFYLSQLNYDKDSGRCSTLEMIKAVTNAFPAKALQDNSPIIFVNVSTSLINDPQPECRKQAAEIIGLLLNRIDNNCKDKLFDVALLWLKNSKVTHRRLAAQVIGLFVASEKENFEKRLPELLPLISKQFFDNFQKKIPGRFVLLNPPKQTAEPTEIDNALSDHHLYHVLHLFVKIASVSPQFLINNDYVDYIETIAENAQSLLAHEHDWVRFTAVQVLGQIVSATPSMEYANIINDETLERPGYLLSDTQNKLKSLTLDLIAQLISSEEEVNEKLLMQCMKLLVYLAEILSHLNSDDPQQLSLLWLVKRIRRKANLEVVHAPKSIIVRKMCFNWIAAVAVKLNRNQLEPIVEQLLFPLAREMNQTDNDSSLRKIATEAANFVKNKIGNDNYRAVIAEITKQLEIRKADRRKERSQLMVTNPERAAKRKINKQIKKKEMKKRKTELVKNHKYKKKMKKDVFEMDE